MQLGWGARTHAPQLNRPRLIQVLRETHETPAEVQDRLTLAGGVNRLDEPNFRVVWGGSRFSWVGGNWIDRDSQGNLLRERVELRQAPKYLPINRWHVERWLPPEAYGSRERWYRETTECQRGILIPALGPYPSRGEYEHCFTLEKNGEFVQLSATACEWIARAIHWARRQPASVSRAALISREARAARDWDQNADALLADATRAFSGQPFVSVGATP